MIDIQNFARPTTRKLPFVTCHSAWRVARSWGWSVPTEPAKPRPSGLTGIIPSSGGTIEVAGYDLSSSPREVKLRTAYVPDDPQLFHDLTVEQHLAFTASAYQVEHATGENRVAAGPVRIGVQASLAGCGFCHAVCVKNWRSAAATCMTRSRYLLDEPMTGLDPPGIRMLKRSIVERAEAGAAVVISSHLLAMVEDICTHVLILNNGQKRFFGGINDMKAAFAKGEASSLEDIFFAALGSAARVGRQPPPRTCFRLM